MGGLKWRVGDVERGWVGQGWRGSVVRVGGATEPSGVLTKTIWVRVEGWWSVGS
jgi:hypothetical protein